MRQPSSDVLREIYPRVLARTLAFTRSLPEAEDAVQEAVVRALGTWGERGTPDCPEAWLQTVAANVHRDRLRKTKWEAPAEDALERLSQLSPWVRIALGEPEIARGWKDELLGLAFSCCHPALETGESAALCLSTIVGLSTREIALAFVSETRTMEQRLTRARRRLRERGDPDGCSPERSRDRLAAVLQVIRLLFNEGYWSSDPKRPIRADLCRLAIGLARSLYVAFPEEPDVLGLLALLLLHDARREARVAGDGTPIPLPEQDRTRWDRDSIALATELLARASELRSPGPIFLEAAISAVHCHATTAGDTDWERIAALYEELETLQPTPAVRVNRAHAVGRARGARAGIELLDDRSQIDCEAYPYVHLVRGTLLAELGREDEARACLARALSVPRNSAERAQIEARLAQLGGDAGPQGTRTPQ